MEDFRGFDRKLVVDFGTILIESNHNVIQHERTINLGK